MRVGDSGFVCMEDGTFWTWFVVVGLWGAVGGGRGRGLNVDTPSGACAFDVEAFA